MKKIFISILLIIFVSKSFGQIIIPRYERAQWLKNKTLIIALQELSKKETKRIAKNPKKYKYYQEELDEKNQVLQNAAEKYWNFSRIIIKPLSEAQRLVQEHPDDYAMLRITRTTVYETYRSSSSKFENGVYTPAQKRTQVADVLTAFSIEIKDFLIAKAFLPLYKISPSDAAYGMTQLNYIFSFVYENQETGELDHKALMKKNTSLLKERTLLLRIEDLNLHVDEDNIEENYPYKFKIATTEEYEQAILDRSPEFIIVQLIDIPALQGSTKIQLLCTTEDGAIIDTFEPRAVFKDLNAEIRKRHFKKYAEMADE